MAGLFRNLAALSINSFLFSFTGHHSVSSYQSYPISSSAQNTRWRIFSFVFDDCNVSFLNIVVKQRRTQTERQNKKYADRKRRKHYSPPRAQTIRSLKMGTIRDEIMFKRHGNVEIREEGVKRASQRKKIKRLKTRMLGGRSEREVQDEELANGN